MPEPWSFRDASAGDAQACADIYAPYVTDTVISFEAVPPSAAEMAERILSAQRRHVWLVGTDREQVIGYAYGGPYKPRAAYRWTCEVSVYVDSTRRRRGIGRALYEALFARLAERGYRTLLAGMTLPNEASVGLHRALGFAPVGTLSQVGWKHGNWHDVGLMQRAVADGPAPPAEPH